MRGSQFATLLLVLAVVSLLIAIYYIIPGIYHILASSDHPATDPRPTHFIVFLALAVLAFIGSRFVGSSRQG
jgi:hypothetical protein